MTPEERAEMLIATLGCYVPGGWAHPGDEAVAHITTEIRAAIRETWQAAIEAVRESCGGCNGSGYTESSHADHACGGDDRLCATACPVEVLVQEECEYCGRPIAAIRAKAEASRG